MTAWKVEVTQTAERDILDINTYLEFHSGTYTANRFREELRNKLTLLKTNPEVFPPVNAIVLAHNSEYRKLSINQYLIIYSIWTETETVVVERVLHARRNWSSII